MQHVRRGISIEKQIQKRNTTFTNTISKFESISFAVESIKKFQECTFGPTPDSKNVINKTLVQLIIKVIHRPTQSPLCGFAVVAHEPLKFCSDERIFERFAFYI